MNAYHDIQHKCYEANLLLPHHRLADLTFGNVSVASHADGVFAIKPSGVDYAHLRAADMVVIRIADGEVMAGTMRPSSDTPTHRRLFQAFGPAAGAVVHTHSRTAVAWAQAGRPIPCLGTTHADHFHGEVPVTRPLTAGEIGGDQYEWETGNVIVERLAGLDPGRVGAVLVHGHGPFVWGANGKKAVENALALEIIAEMALKTLQLHPEAPPISRELLDKHFLRKHGTGAYYGQEERGIK